ncbi:hypothetical protein VTP01DRAFT_439 [Rhizomucor pusillus]|uniref:uncharacterized protein n=1 Tax=Rhizomucor pusillus TaxID=4840 RepID=UPI0037432892
MAEIKIESREPSLPPIVSKETLESIHGSESKDDEIEWDASMELALLSAVARCKPVGMHKHFRIVSIQHQFKQRTGKSLSLKEIWERLSAYYGLEALEELEAEDEEEAAEEGDANRSTHEFSLPLDEYEHIISEHRQDGTAEATSPSPPPAKRSRTVKRETSPTSSSATPTPEPEEGKPTTRRSARSNTKKTETRKSGRTSASTSSSKGGSSGTTSRRKRR